jgi:hypothetical protein
VKEGKLHNLFQVRSTSSSVTYFDNLTLKFMWK